MKTPPDELLVRLHASLKELLAALHDMERSARRVSLRTNNAAEVVGEISKYMED